MQKVEFSYLLGKIITKFEISAEDEEFEVSITLNDGDELFVSYNWYQGKSVSLTSFDILMDEPITSIESRIRHVLIDEQVNIISIYEVGNDKGSIIFNSIEHLYRA